jgi:hypothetical protein
MGKKISIFYCIFSILFFIALFLLFFVRVSELKKTNTQRIQAGFDQVRHIIETTYTRQASFDSLYFKDTVNKIFSLDRDLDLLVVYSYDTGIEYLRARNSRYLPGTQQDIASLRGVPRFSYNNFSRTQIASSIAVPRKSSFIIEGVYRILHDGELFIVIRDTVIILIIFAVITAALALLLRLLDDGRQALPVRKISPPPAERPAVSYAIPMPPPSVRPAPAFPPLPPAPAEKPVVKAPSEEAAPAPEAPEIPPRTGAGEAPVPVQEKPAPPREASPLPAAAVKTVPVPAPAPLPPQADAAARQEAPPQTGWRAAMEKRISLELDRAAYNEQDLTLIILKFSGLIQGSADYQRIAQEIRKKLSFEDLTFEYPPDGYAVVLPNANLDQAFGTLKNFLKTIDTELPMRESSPLCGLSSRAGRLIDGARLLLESEEALKRTKEESPDSIIGFKSDPVKYRAYLAEKETEKADS